jgi:hypothetical protein
LGKIFANFGLNTISLIFEALWLLTKRNGSDKNLETSAEPATATAGVEVELVEAELVGAGVVEVGTAGVEVELVEAELVGAGVVEVGTAGVEVELVEAELVGAGVVEVGTAGVEVELVEAELVGAGVIEVVVVAAVKVFDDDSSVTDDAWTVGEAGGEKNLLALLTKLLNTIAPTIRKRMNIFVIRLN